MKKYGALGLALLFVVVLAACGKKPAIENEKHVSLHYKGTLADGSTFDSSEGKEPLAFVYGVGMMIPGLETGIKGMKAGQKKTVLVKAEEAYGPYREDLVMPVPRDQFPAELKPEVGMQLMAQTMFGPVPVTIKELTVETVFVDYNAPLAGKDLTFDVEIVEVRDSTEEELAPFRKAAEATPLPSGALPPVPGAAKP